MRWTSRHEDLNGFVVIAVGTLIERTLDAGLALYAAGGGVGGPRGLLSRSLVGHCAPQCLYQVRLCWWSFQIRCLPAPMLHREAGSLEPRAPGLRDWQPSEQV